MQGSGGGSVVLVVEDEALLRMATVDGLTDAGFELLEASDASEAIDLLRRRVDIAAVFTDIDMPGSLDGIALANVVHRRWPAVRLVLTSGHAMPEWRKRPPGSLFVPKPYRMQDVAQALRDAVSSSYGRAGGRP